MQDRRKIAIINADFFTISSPEKVREGNIRFVRDSFFAMTSGTGLTAPDHPRDTDLFPRIERFRQIGKLLLSDPQIDAMRKPGPDTVC